MFLCRVYDGWHMNTRVNYHLDEGLSLFAVLNLGEPPRKLASDNKKNYHCHFSLPLPNQVIVFGLGDWDYVPRHSKINVDVWLDTDLPPVRVGSLSSDKRCLCWEAKWDEAFLDKSLDLHSQDRMAKLTVTFENDPFSFLDEEKENCQDTVQTSPQVAKQKIDTIIGRDSTPRQTNNKKPGGTLKQQKLFFSGANCSEGTDSNSNGVEFKSKTFLLSPKSSSLTKKETRKKRRISVESPAVKKQKGLTRPKQLTSPSATTKQLSSVELPTPPNTPGCTPTSSHKSHDYVPSGRWGHAFVMIDSDTALAIGGQGNKQMMVKDSFCILNTKTNAWSIKDKESDAERRMGHTITYNSLQNQLYVYGGSKNKRWFSDVHILNLQTWIWSNVKTVGKAPTRAYHTAVLFCNELFIFGGNFPNPDPQSDGCSNELHVFDPDKKSWYKPLVTGETPAPRSGHSASLLGEKLVIFGGWDAPKCFNDVFILDLALMEFTCPKMMGTPPKARCWHTSTTLQQHKVFIHGGFDGSRVLGDAFLFELDSYTWTAFKPPSSLCPRVGHAAITITGHKDSENSDLKILVFGGGNNCGGYFNDLVSIPMTSKTL